MEKDKRVFLIIIITICLVAIVLGIYLFKNKDSKNIINSNKEALKFKNEYESLNNNNVSDNTKNVFQTLEIDENNPMKYIGIEETIEKITNGTGIFYFGYPESGSCRTAVRVLLDVAKNNEIKDIYYLNVYEIRDEYIYENNTLIKTREEQEGYLTLLELLKDYLNDYVVISESQEEINTNEKRLEVPTVIAVKDGKISDFHYGTIELNRKQNEYSILTTKQYNTLYSRYETLIKSISNESFCTGIEECN